MESAYVAYDSRSGQIISMHRGHVDDAHVRQRAQHYTKIDAEHVSVIEVRSEAFERGKFYKVDVNRRALVETTAREGGVGFSFGRSGSIAAG